MEQIPNNQYFITYSNSFSFEGILLAFRKKELFNITETPVLVPFNEKANCWIVRRKQLTISKAKELVTNNKITKDLSDLQWYVQVSIDGVFNLN